MNPLERLRRKDKWFLGGGTGSIYAPVFPNCLASIGFWDECYYADVRLERLFTGLFLCRQKPIRFHSRVLDWRPDRLLIEHASEDVLLRETRVVLPCHAYISKIEALKAPKEPLDAVLWSLPSYDPSGVGAPFQSVAGVESRDGVLQYRLDTAWPLELEPDRTATEDERAQGGREMGRPLPLFVTLGADRDAQNTAVQHTQRHHTAPLHELCALHGYDPHSYSGGGFLRGDAEPGLVHLCLTYRLSEGETILFGASAGLAPEDSQRSLEEGFAADPAEASEKSWSAYFAGVPQFSSSDEHLTNAYWHRWYGLRLNTVAISNLPIMGADRTFAPFVTEGVGFFRNFVTYSAQAHLREAVWMRDPSLALGILQNLPRIQRPDGSLPGHSYSCRPGRDFYHADFATGCAMLADLHGVEIDGEVADALARYLGWFVAERLAEDRSGFLIFDQNETGQEYMSRYQFASARADKWESFRLVGVDATVYVLRLARMMRGLGERQGRRDWMELADRALSETQPRAYDAEARFLCDSLEGGPLSPSRPATGLYGLTDHALGHTPEQEREIVERWLAQPGSFREEYGFFAEASSEPTFSPDGVWKGKRLNCPWNGRSWPMANSHVIDELAACARRNPEYRPLAADALMGCIRMMFHDGDPGRPNSYEHYDPITGAAATYRGYDDYMHSWVVDLILRHAVGYRPDSKTFDPLPLAGVEWIECGNLPDPSGPREVRIVGGKTV